MRLVARGRAAEPCRTRGRCLTMAKLNPIEVQKALKGVDYPATKDDIVQTAERNGADQEILEALRNLSGNRFETPADVQEGLDFGGDGQ